MQIKIIDAELYKPEELLPKTQGSAGIDLKLCQTVVAVRNHLIGTGIAVAIPEGYVGIVCPRSSAGHKRKFSLGNTIGVIDSDYRGEIKLSVCCPDMLERGEAVAQLFVVPVMDLSKATIVDNFDSTTDRNEGGFGSTDKV